MKESALYFINDVESLVNRSRKTIYRWCERGIFPKPTILAKQYIWTKKEVDQWFNDNFQLRI